jgi:uncharacterized membrane protein
MMKLSGISCGAAVLAVAPVFSRHHYAASACGIGTEVHKGPLRRSRLLGLGFVFLWFLIGGIGHFAATDLEMRIVPPYVPWPHATVLITGCFELLGAAGLLLPASRRAAGAGLFALTIAVTPANIYMLQQAQQFAVPYWLLLARLPLQLGLLVLIWWSAIRRR